jgi:hypothetical protein
MAILMRGQPLILANSRKSKEFDEISNFDVSKATLVEPRSFHIG